MKIDPVYDSYDNLISENEGLPNAMVEMFRAEPSLGTLWYDSL